MTTLTTSSITSVTTQVGTITSTPSNSLSSQEISTLQKVVSTYISTFPTVSQYDGQVGAISTPTGSSTTTTGFKAISTVHGFSTEKTFTQYLTNPTTFTTLINTISAMASGTTGTTGTITPTTGSFTPGALGEIGPYVTTLTAHLSAFQTNVTGYSTVSGTQQTTYKTGLAIQAVGLSLLASVVTSSLGMMGVSTFSSDVYSTVVSGGTSGSNSSVLAAALHLLSYGYTITTGIAPTVSTSSSVYCGSYTGTYSTSGTSA